MRVCRWPGWAHLIALLWLVTAGLAAEAQGPPTPLPAPAHPQGEGISGETAALIERLAAAIDAAEKQLPSLEARVEDLGRLRADVETILAQASEAADTLRPQLAAVRTQVTNLGPAPEKDAPPEAGAIAGERARLNALASSLDGAIKASSLNGVRARQLIEKITVLRRALFARNLMQRLPSPLLPPLWRDLNNETPAAGARLGDLAGGWIAWAAPRTEALTILVAAALLLYLALRLLTARITRRRPLAIPPTLFERTFSVARVAPLRALPAILAGLILYGGLDAMELLFPPWARTAAALFGAVVVIACLSALTKAVLGPREPAWRLLPLADLPARRIARLLYAITGLYALDAALTEMSRVFYPPLAFSVVQSLATSTLFAALLIGLVATPFTPEGDAPVPRYRPRWLKVPLLIAALAILGLSLLGFIALARFTAEQVMMSGMLVAACWLLYLAIRAVTREGPQRRYPLGALLEARFGLDAPRRRQLARLSELALTFVLVIGAIPFLMLQWGFSGADIRDGFKALLFGMEIGQFRISLARILIGIVLFIALLFATRVLQRWLRERALQATRLDSGIVNSVDTVIGYAGSAIAALIAVSYAGLDISNLAIVAGALSVGIGFGLQSIVNNFVSGLILLIERPIKVGDWIVLGNEQGNVRRISVRATEIETFDRASLIVPNSELITGRVLNWTHRNAVGRVILRIGVGYNADPEEVMAILRAVAKGHPGVLAVPEPVVAFDNFGDSALEFSLRVYLADIAQALGTQTTLRVAILKELRAANIEIPFKQLDVNLHQGIKVLSRHIGGERPASPEAPRPGNGKPPAPGDA
jgi:small-conductance mechanosensitive channel